METKSKIDEQVEVSLDEMSEETPKVESIYVSNDTAYEMTLEAQGTLLYNGQ